MTKAVTMPDPGPLVRACAAHKQLICLLGQHHDRWGVSRPLVRHPDVRRTVERAADRMEQVLAPDVPCQLRDQRLTHLLDLHEPWLNAPLAPTLEQVWALADGLRSVWIAAAPKKAITAYAFSRDQPPVEGAESGDEETFRRVLERQHQMRRNRGAHERARAALRGRYLRRVGRILWALVAAALCVGLVVAPAPGVLILSGVAGAIGGTLSGARALRDSTEVERARGFSAWWWVQPAVGAAVGMFLYALLLSPVLKLPGTDTGPAEPLAAAYIAYAFVAGFSEPFLLGVLGKLTGAADRAADQAASPPEAGASPGAIAAVQHSR